MAIWVCWRTVNLVHASRAALPWIGLAGIAAGVVITGILPLFVDSGLMTQEDRDYVRRMVANERMIPTRLLTQRGRNLSRLRYGCFVVGFCLLLAMIVQA